MRAACFLLSSDLLSSLRGQRATGWGGRDNLGVECVCERSVAAAGLVCGRERDELGQKAGPPVRF